MRSRQTKKNPTCEESGNSKSIHLRPANNPYINMIVTNKACESFCVEVLQHFDDLLNRYCPDRPRAYKGNELDAFISLFQIDREANR
jgi:hypothetical protein